GTTSGDSPTQGAFQGLKGTANAFVAKLLPDGSKPIFSTYLGGSARDTGFGIGVDGRGYVYVTGEAGSDDFPTVRPILPGGDKLQGATDAFLARLVPTGCSIAYSTYFGGKNDEAGHGVAGTPRRPAPPAGATHSDTPPHHPPPRPPAVASPDPNASRGGRPVPFGAVVGHPASPGGAGNKPGPPPPACETGFPPSPTRVKKKGTPPAHALSALYSPPAA